jgi:hypothetical protein
MCRQLMQGGTPPGDDMRNRTRTAREVPGRLAWLFVALACVGGYLLAVAGEDAAYVRQLDAAQTHARAWANAVVAPDVTSQSPGSVKFTYRELYTKVQAEVFTDPSAARLRLWSEDGSLLFSTDRTAREEIRVENDPGIEAAIAGGTYRQVVTEIFTWDTTGSEGMTTELFQTYSPLLVGTRVGPVAVVQVDFFVDELERSAVGPWPTVRLVLVVVFILSLSMLLLSMRPRRATAVPDASEAAPEDDESEAPTAAPKGSAKRIRTLERETSRLQEQVRASQEQLLHAEEAYRYLEERLRQVQAHASASSDDTPTRRIAELEEALASTQGEVALLRADALERAAEPQADVEALVTRLTQAESSLIEAQDRATVAEAETASARGLLATLEQELADAREAAAEARLSRQDPVPNPVPEAPVKPRPEPESAPATAPDASVAAHRPAAVVDDEPPQPSEDPLSRLQAELADAGGRIADRTALPPVEAADLRSRLARTAARKKGIVPGEDDDAQA